MTLSVKTHGVWTRYQPEKIPEHMPPNVMFCRRESDGADWYDYQAKKPFAADTIKMTILTMGDGRHIVQAATRDASALFPQQCSVIEVSGSDAKDPQAEYGGKEYNPSASDAPMFAAPAPFMMALTDRQFFQELALRGLITKQEALTAVRGGALPAKLQAVLNGFSADDRFDADMWIAGNSLERTNPYMEQFRTAFDLSEAEFDEFWRHAMTLGNPPPPGS